MKVVEKEIEQMYKTKVNKYIADDGTEFDHEFQCIRYEYGMTSIKDRPLKDYIRKLDREIERVVTIDLFASNTDTVDVDILDIPYKIDDPELDDFLRKVKEYMWYKNSVISRIKDKRSSIPGDTASLIIVSSHGDWNTDIRLLTKSELNAELEGYLWELQERYEYTKSAVEKFTMGDAL